MAGKRAPPLDQPASVPQTIHDRRSRKHIPDLCRGRNENVIQLFVRHSMIGLMYVQVVHGNLTKEGGARNTLAPQRGESLPTWRRKKDSMPT